MTALRALAAAHAIDTKYHDWQGRPQVVGDDTLRAVLAAFGVDASTPVTCRAALAAVERAGAARVLPPCLVVRAGRAADVDTPATAADPRVEWRTGRCAGWRSHRPACASQPACRPVTTGWSS